MCRVGLRHAVGLGAGRSRYAQGGYASFASSDGDGDGWGVAQGGGVSGVRAGGEAW